jgi:hypothetical protein
MRVRDLIERLSKLDPDLPVVRPTDDSLDYCFVEATLIDTVAVVGSGVQLSDERDSDCRAAIRLFGAPRGSRGTSACSRV